jgi:hypothetical protein
MAVKRTVKKTVKKTSKRISRKKLQRGSIGNFFVFGVLALLMVLGITAVGGLPSQMAPTSGQVVNIVTPTPGSAHNNLQLKWFGYVTIAPTPTPVKSSLCTNRSVNTEPIILSGYSPAPGQAVGNTGQIKVWVNDEGAPFVAPGEKIDMTTGAVTTPGNRTAKAQDGYLYEPALYISPSTAESGGAAHFPDFIKGEFNNNPPTFRTVVKGPKIDPLPPGSNPIGGPNPNGFAFNQYTAEYIWNVTNLGLTSGTYQAEFVIHDGDIDRGVGCVSITIQ